MLDVFPVSYLLIQLKYFMAVHILHNYLLLPCNKACKVS